MDLIKQKVPLGQNKAVVNVALHTESALFPCWYEPLGNIKVT